MDLKLARKKQKTLAVLRNQTTTLAMTTTPVFLPNGYDDVEEMDDVSNDTEINKPHQEENIALLWMLTFLYLANLFAALLLNFATFKQLITKRNKRIRFVTNPYVLCLLITNVVWPSINIPFNLVQTWTPYWRFGSVMCRLFPVIQKCFPDAISLTLCLIAIERYISVIHPFKKNPLLKRSVSLTVLAFVWLISLGSSVVFAFSHDQVEFDDGNYVCTIPEGPEDSIITSQAFIESYKVLQSVVFLLVIPGLVFPFCYGQIIFKVFAMQTPNAKLPQVLLTPASPLPRDQPSFFDYSNSRAGSTATASNLLNDSQSEKLERRRRAVTTLSILCAFVHFACWTPIVVFQLVHYIRSYPTLTTDEFFYLKCFILLASANPTLNSLLYAAALYRGITKSISGRLRNRRRTLQRQRQQEDREMEHLEEPQLHLVLPSSTPVPTRPNGGDEDFNQTTVRTTLENAGKTVEIIKDGETEAENCQRADCNKLAVPIYSGFSLPPNSAEASEGNSGGDLVLLGFSSCLQHNDNASIS